MVSSPGEPSGGGVITSDQAAVETVDGPVSRLRGNVTSVIRLEKVSKTYRTSEVETRALDGVSMQIGPGEFVAVMGPSGCGKSTLLNVLGLLDSPTSGAYDFFGEDVARCPERRLTDLRRDRIGFGFQSFNLIDDLTVAENVEVALIYRGVSGADRRRRVAEALERVGCTASSTASTCRRGPSCSRRSRRWRSPGSPSPSIRSPWPGPGPPARCAMSRIVAAGVGLLALAACSRGGPSTEQYWVKRTAAAEALELWSIQVFGAKTPPVLICADAAMRIGFVKPAPGVGATPCILLNKPVETASDYAFRCELGDREWAVVSWWSGDRGRDFTDHMSVTSLDEPRVTYAQSLRYRRVGVCPAGWSAGEFRDRQGRVAQGLVRWPAAASAPS